jgi:nitroreductase
LSVDLLKSILPEADISADGYTSTVELDEVMRTTAAVRTFLDQPVPDETLYRVLERARFAPSGGNRQGWRVIVVRRPELRRAVRDAFVLGVREYVGHAIRGLVPFAPGPDGRWSRPAIDLDEARAIERPNEFADHLDQVPIMLVLCVELTALAVMDNGLDRQSIVGGGSVYPFGHNLLLSARNEGLGGVLTTIICRQEKALRELLSIPDDFAVAGLLALGHPVHQVTRLSRRPVEDFAFIDTFGGAPFAAPC